MFHKVAIGDKIGLLAVSLFLLLSAPLCANSADSVMVEGDFRISGWGNLVFPDGSIQNSAYLPGPVGDLGPVGPPGPQGPAVPSYTTINYYALGDSITYGTGSTSGSYSYADILHSKFNFNSFTKLAVGGTTVMLSTGLSVLATQIDAIGADADLITVLIGVNDCNVGNNLGNADTVMQIPYANLDISLSFAEAFRYSLETIKRNHEQARIYVILPLQLTRPWSASLEQYRTIEIKIANQLSIPVIFAHTESGLWGSAFMPDGVHPSDTGYTFLGNYIARKIIGL